MTTEIDEYIAAHKAKIAKERREAYEKAAANVENNQTGAQTQEPRQRKQWDRDASQILNDYAVKYGRGEDSSRTVETENLSNRIQQLEFELQDEKPKQKPQTAKKPTMSNRPPTPQDGGSLNIGGSVEEKRRKLQQERHREYNQMLAQTGSSGRKPLPSPGRASDLTKRTDKPKPQRNFQSDEDAPKENQPVQNGYKENIPPPRTQGGRVPPPPPALHREETPEQGLIAKLGSYEQRKKKLNAERKQEYNQLLAQGGGEKVPPLWLQEGPPKTQQNAAGRNRVDTAPGVTEDNEPEFDREEDSQRLDMSEDDDEDAVYSRYLRERVPRRGWATPTYEEVLDKKRREERAYRRADDLGLRASRSDGNLNRQLQDDLRKLKDLDREYESKKVRFANTERGKRILDDPEWLGRDPKKITDLYEDSDLYSEPDNRDDGRLNRVERELSRPSRQGQAPQTNRRGVPTNDGYQATLNIGGNVRASADQRRKAAYRKELERQMKEAESNKKREKQEDLRVNATGANDVFRNPTRTNLPPPSQQPSRLLDDNFSPRTILFSDDKSKRGIREPGILENGFDSLYPSTVNNPSTSRGSRGVLAAGGQAPLEAYNTPLDDAYYYYGKVNPLDPGSGAPVQGGVSLQDQLGVPQENTPRVTFADTKQSSQRGGRIPKAATGTGEVLPFASDDDRSRSRQESKKNYQQELLRQMEEDKRRKEAAKLEKEKYEQKLENEIRNYDPFGKGGGGAPMRDYEGNVMADLRKMKQDNDETLLSGRKSKEYRDHSLEPPVSVRLEVPSPSNANNPDDVGYARGGNGIFGEPMNDRQKNAQTKYQDELSKQIEEKKRQKELEKQKIKEEEEKLLRKIEEDQRKAKEQFEEEKRKEREKAAAAQRAQEEVQRQQEEKKQQEDRRRQEAEERRQEELRRKEEERRTERENQGQGYRNSSPPIPTLRDKQSSKPQSRGETRGRSPPVPALRSKTEPESRAGPSTDRGKSPPIPAQRTQSRQSRVQSADVLNQLARMKQQLKNESKRVEADLRNEQEEPEVYDPRLQRRAEPQTTVDIFDVAGERERLRKPSVESADPNTVNEFKKLKKGNTSSRQKLHKMFPETPTNSDALETQQRALLEAQEREGRGGGKSPFAKRMPDMNPKGMGLFREQSVVSANLLDSDSAFIDVPNGIPGSLDGPSRNDTARSRRRQRPMDTPSSYRAPSSRSVYDPSNMGSQVSLNPDAINRKNEDRLRKLKSLTGDEVSMGDPDDILDRFMAKQQHYRPPSGHTLQDDSWLRPGTHADR